jgi:serine protease Do
MPCKPLVKSWAYPLLILWALAPLAAGLPGVRAADAPPKVLGPPPAPGRPAAVPAPKDLAELKAIEEKVKQVAARVIPCTVALRVGPSQGSGVIVSKDGYVLTAGHVIGKPGQSIAVVLQGGKTLKGTTLGLNQDADAGLAKITDKGDWPFVEMGKAGSIQRGMWCLAFGHPLGLQDERPPPVRFGRVLQVRESFIQSDCTIVAGDSGGPLVDLEGRVIGINSRITTGMTTMNFHVPIDTFHENWDRLVKSEVLHAPIDGRDSPPVKGLFHQVVADAGRCVVRVRCEGRDVALGTIVGPDGWVLTKASQLKGRVVCRTRDGQQREARLVGVHEGFDLAMLKIEAAGLPRIAWAAEGKCEVGQWVATPGLEDAPPLALGVVSVPPRRIPPTSGVLGIVLGEPESPARIREVTRDSPAQKAGLQQDDVVTHLNDKPVASRDELIRGIKQFRPGKTVRLTIKRGDKVLQITATLGRLDTPASKKRDTQNLAPPGVSERRDDFPKVLQHDTVLVPTDCGGPLVDLSGRVVGVNIARAGRTETYAVPTDALVTLLYDLISGRLPPPPPEPKPDAKPELKATPKPEPKPGPKPAPKPEPKPEPKPAPKPDAKPQPKAEPKPQAKPEQKPQPKAEPKPEAPKVPPPKVEPPKTPEPPKAEAPKPPPPKPEPSKPAPAKPEPSKPAPAKRDSPK